MLARALCCVDCAQEHPPRLLYRCARCGGVLDVEYSQDEPDERAAPPGRGIWRWQARLPVQEPRFQVSLGEAGTPLIPLPRLADELGVAFLAAKADSDNPTGSFKDRPVSVGVSRALELGFTRAACASTGNNGASAAAYCARAGLPYWCLVPERTPPQKLSQIAAHGARLVRVRGSYSDAYRVAEALCERGGIANLSSTYLNPYMLEGDKTVAYELLEELGRAPDWVIIPIGAGPLLAGVLKGFEELYAARQVEHIPRPVGVQAEGCAPIARAFQLGADRVFEWDDPLRTTAGAIADPLVGYARHGTYTLRRIREGRGVAVAVSDAETAWARQRLAAEGIYAETSAATPIAALRRLREADAISADALVVALVTGHGLKDAGGAEDSLAAAPLVDADPDAVLPLLN